MPVLSDFRKSVEIELPQYEGAKIELYESVLVKDLGDTPLIGADSKASDVAKVIPLFIKSWNFTDAEGKDLPVTAENIMLLRVDALQVIVEKIAGNNTDQKKA